MRGEYGVFVDGDVHAKEMMNADECCSRVSHFKGAADRQQQSDPKTDMLMKPLRNPFLFARSLE